jgi:hypothetical protein
VVALVTEATGENYVAVDAFDLQATFGQVAAGFGFGVLPAHLGTFQLALPFWAARIVRTCLRRTSDVGASEMRGRGMVTLPFPPIQKRLQRLWLPVPRGGCDSAPSGVQASGLHARGQPPSVPGRRPSKRHGHAASQSVPGRGGRARTCSYAPQGRESASAARRSACPGDGEQPEDESGSPPCPDGSDSSGALALRGPLETLRLRA